MILCFVANLEQCHKYTFLGGSAQIITILHRGGHQNLLQYYNGGRVSRDPKFVLRNIWTAPYDTGNVRARLLHRLPRVLFSKLFRDQYQDQHHDEAPKLKDALQFSGCLWVGGGGGWSNHSRFIAFAILPSHPCYSLAIECCPTP